MKISIVTISYNQGQFIRRCIDSVLSQRDDLRKIGVELEYIVVDPGSTDESRRIIESYGDVIIKLFEKDKGPADGLNKGFSVATGDIYGYVNSDDYFLQGAFVKVALIFKKNYCDIFSAHGWVVDEYDTRQHRCLSHKFSLKQYALGNCVVMQQSTFFKCAAFSNAGGFNIENKVSWDGELMVDMVLAGAKTIRISDYLSCFRVYSTSISGSGDFLEAAIIEHYRIIKKIFPDKDIGRFSSLIEKIICRLSDPAYLLIRVIDGVRYGKRKIPT